MIFTTTETISLVKSQRRDQFLSAMFLPPELREVAIAIYALDIELEHVHHVVKEEMMGHIRYAWWQEAVEQLIQEKMPREQPLLQALAKVTIKLDFLMPIVTAYREHYPNPPVEIEKIVQEAVENALTSYPSHKGIKKWRKATAIINKHRREYGLKHNNRLLAKLLFV